MVKPVAFLMLVFVLVFIPLTASAQPLPGSSSDEVVGAGAVGAFYDALTPYGNWVYTDTCGWVWYPYDVPVDWRPYTNGHWEDSDAGWTFVSNDPYGWAVYHYGRWYFDDTYGWVWCPGLTWAPSWVAWRRGDDYIGWAPIRPSVPWDNDNGFVTTGIDFDTAFPAFSWCFVPFDDFLAPDCDDFLILSARNVTIFGFTNFFFDFDFDREHHFCRNRFRDEDDFERRFEDRTHHHIEHVRLGDLDAPGVARREGDQLRVFRPNLHTEEGRQRAGQLPIGHAGAKPPELTFRQEDQRRVLEERINAHRGMLDEAQRNEIQHLPQGITEEQVRARHEAETRAFENHADTQRKLLGNMHEREDRMWMAPEAPPRQRFDVTPPRTVPREAVPTPSRPTFPQPVFERGYSSGGFRGGETRTPSASGGGVTRDGSAIRGGESRGDGGISDGGGFRGGDGTRGGRDGDPPADASSAPAGADSKNK